MMGLGWQELAIILVIVIVIFGAGKLPEIGSGLGKGIRGFKEESGIGDEKKDKAAIDHGTSTTASNITTTEAPRAQEPVNSERGTRADDI